MTRRLGLAAGKHQEEQHDGEPWAPGHKGHWVRIRTNTVSGRRIVLAADAVPGYRA